MATKKKLTFAEKKARAKALGTGLEKRKKLSPEDQEQFNKAQHMADLYARFLGEYRYTPTQKYTNVVSKDHRAFKHFLNAANFADELNIPRDVYMKAQFFYLHKWKGRAPYSYELATRNKEGNSVDRAVAFTQDVPKASVQEKKVTARYTGGKASKEARFRNSESVLKTFKKAYNLTEEQIFRQFKPATAYFDWEWLKANTLYMKLKHDGELE